MSLENAMYYDSIPVGRLGLIPLQSCATLGEKVNRYLVSWRKSREHEEHQNMYLDGYDRDSFIISSSVPRFGTGEAKGVIGDSIRGDDIYIMVDVCNYSLTYKLFGQINHMSPDDHYQELINMGVDNIITFDAHDPRVQNAIPLDGFETVTCAYQFIKNILRYGEDIHIDADHLMVVSPDEGGMTRSIYIANNLGVDMGMLYKRRDYSTIIDGRNPIVAHEFLGADVAGKDIIIADDMISSGDTIIDVARLLKEMGARNVYMCSTFGMFTNGLSKFDDAYKAGYFKGLFTTNLIYQPAELLTKPYYHSCDLSKYIALIIDTLNHDSSISSLLEPSGRIQKILRKYANHEKI